MIANMIQNSIQVCEGKPEIEVWAGAINQHMMLIRVSDNGPGIPNDVIDQVFDPFFTTRAAGTGLGLAVLASVVQRHGGTVHADQPRIRRCSVHDSSAGRLNLKGINIMNPRYLNC